MLEALADGYGDSMDDDGRQDKEVIDGFDHAIVSSPVHGLITETLRGTWNVGPDERKVHSRSQVLSRSVIGQLLERDLRVEDSSDTDGPKVARENGLPPGWERRDPARL